jgi:pimeloyl-ACP methyl ester carboxylesterase
MLRTRCDSGTPGWLTLALLVCSAVLSAAPPAAPAGAQASASASLRVGQLRLHRCRSPAPWCGTLVRPLDPSGSVPGTIAVYFEYYPHSVAGPASGTLVATEGGPGYPATGSRDQYLALFAPLRAHQDVVIMDNRGTGRSAALDCRELQNAPQLTESNIGACGRSLGRAAPLYSTALAADDLAAVLDALHVGRVSLYGDSYGTYFAQVFTLRHPQRVRALVLDGAYPLDGADYPWYPHYAPAMRDKFNRACERSADCRAIAGSSLEHIAPALALLRQRPFPAQARAGDGRLVRFTADATALAIVMFGGAPALSSLRETDAAARAFAAGDQAPLLRLMAETLVDVDSRDPSHAPGRFSAGLAAAVFCQDPPQIFDMSLAPEQRLRARAAAIAERKAAAPDSYAPFSIDEYRAMPLDYAFIDECVRWPAKAARSPALPLVPPGARYPQVPVLVLSGELDNMTSVADGAAAAARWPDARHVVIANSLHVNALPGARSDCGALLARHFLEVLDPGDTRCAQAVPPVPLVPRFARSADELAPAQPDAGNQADPARLRVVTAALLTAADALARARDNDAGQGVGLRGGSVAVTRAGPGYRLDLRAVRWTSDVSVSGRIDSPGRAAEVRAHLELQSPQGAGTLELAWAEGAGGARATARGTLGGRIVAADAPAP